MAILHKFLFCGLLGLQLSTSQASADLVSNVWTMGTVEPVVGAFRTTRSAPGNTLSAEIVTDSITGNVQLTASNGNWFKPASGATTDANNQLVPFLENDAALTQLTFSSDIPLMDVDLLLHNVWNATDTSVPGGLRTNYIGNFRVTYANGMVVNNVLPTLRAINADSPFETDFDGSTLQPTGLNGVFDGGNIMTVSGPNFDPGNGATPAYYWSDLSQSLMSEMQGFGIFSFDESNGGITELQFTWVGHTIGTNTAFLGFAGKATPASIPEPTGIPMVLAIIAAVSCLRRDVN